MSNINLKGKVLMTHLFYYYFISLRGGITGFINIYEKKQFCKNIYIYIDMLFYLKNKLFQVNVFFCLIYPY